MTRKRQPFPAVELTPEELAFRALLLDPEAYAEWAAEVRAAWELTPTGKAAMARCRRDVGGFRVETRKAAA